jgi:hypothetical protein
VKRRHGDAADTSTGLECQSGQTGHRA